MALAAGSLADTGRLDLPSTSCPALAAAPLVYVLIPSPLGAKTWAERGIGEIRLGAGTEAREDGSDSTTYVLLALHSPRTADAFALEMMEAPRDPPAPLPARSDLSTKFDRGGLVGAFEEMGLKPEDLVEKPELPPAALAVADTIAALSNLIFRQVSGTRDGGPESADLRVDPVDRAPLPHEPRRFGKPVSAPPPTPNVTIYAKRMTRSAYKVLLGAAIGILIWGFVRTPT